MSAIDIDDLRAGLGSDIFCSDWFTIDQPMIDRFAAATGDHQFIHVDPVRAAQTPFGGTIAHGFLTLSLLPVMQVQAVPPLSGQIMAINYGFNRVRMIAPVRVGARIRTRFRPTAIDERRPGEVLVTFDVTVEIDGESKPALIAEWLGLYQFAVG